MKRHETLIFLEDFTLIKKIKILKRMIRESEMQQAGKDHSSGQRQNIA